MPHSHDALGGGTGSSPCSVCEDGVGRRWPAQDRHPDRGAGSHGRGLSLPRPHSRPPTPWSAVPTSSRGVGTGGGSSLLVRVQSELSPTSRGMWHGTFWTPVISPQDGQTLGPGLSAQRVLPGPQEAVSWGSPSQPGSPEDRVVRPLLWGGHRKPLAREPDAPGASPPPEDGHRRGGHPGYLGKLSGHCKQDPLYLIEGEPRPGVQQVLWDGPMSVPRRASGAHSSRPEEFFLGSDRGGSPAAQEGRAFTCLVLGGRGWEAGSGHGGHRQATWVE